MEKIMPANATQASRARGELFVRKENVPGRFMNWKLLPAHRLVEQKFDGRGMNGVTPAGRNVRRRSQVVLAARHYAPANLLCVFDRGHFAPARPKIVWPEHKFVCANDLDGHLRRFDADG
jgi:hypothetical protein